MEALTWKVNYTIKILSCASSAQVLLGRVNSQNSRHRDGTALIRLMTKCYSTSAIVFFRPCLVCAVPSRRITKNPVHPY